MFYRLQITANFPILPTAGYLAAVKQQIMAHSITISPAPNVFLPSSYELHVCSHDEETPKPCELLDSFTTMV